MAKTRLCRLGAHTEDPSHVDTDSREDPTVTHALAESLVACDALYITKWIEHWVHCISRWNDRVAFRFRGSSIRGPFHTVLLIHGRGCGGQGGLSAQARALTRYGLAAVVFDKRGYKDSVACKSSNMRVHAQDVVAISERLRKRKDVDEVGFIGYSAGGWVAPMAASLMNTPPSFIITVVGHSTSVKEQQLDCCRYYLGEKMELGEDAIQEALEYTSLEFSEAPADSIYGALMSLLDSAKVNGWYDVLVPSDIPSSADKIEDLWVRGNRYAPRADLSAYKGPFLSILGTSDYVVPYRENKSRFEEIFESAGKSNYKVTLVPSANHGMEHGYTVRDLGYQQATGSWPVYFKFDRVGAGAIDEMVVFLREYGYIDQP